MNKDNTFQAPNSCCGGPTQQNTEACCPPNEDAESAGSDGCECSTEKRNTPDAEKSTCCG